MWIRFSDDMGKHVGDREMFECPVPGDSINLTVTEPIPGEPGQNGVEEAEFDRYYRVERRQWIPDCMPINGKKIAVLVLLARR